MVSLILVLAFCGFINFRACILKWWERVVYRPCRSSFRLFSFFIAFLFLALMKSYCYQSTKKKKDNVICNDKVLHGYL